METREIERRFVTASDIVSWGRLICPPGQINLSPNFSKETSIHVDPTPNRNRSHSQISPELYEIVKADVIAAAEIMPESGYSLKIDPNVRSFGQQVAHIADAIYLFASSCLGEPNPFPGITPVEAGVLEKTKATKSDIVNVLKSSFAYCDKAFTSASDIELLETVEFPASRNKIVNKAFLLDLAFFHTAEHYGAMTLYLRSQGIVPPSTRRFSQQ